MSTPTFWSGTPGLVLPRGRSTWVTPEMAPPRFHRGVVCELFFARSTSWIKRVRWQHQIDDDEHLGGVLWVHERAGPVRHYSLHNIERLAYFLADRQAIAGIHAARTVEIVCAVARQHGYAGELDAVAREAERDRAAEEV